MPLAARNRKSKIWFYADYMLILCWFYAMRFQCEICGNLGSQMRKPIEINGSLVYIDASFCQKPKIENLILCWFYVHFMLVLCYEISMRNLWKSRLTDEIAHWNKRFSSLYQCLLLPETQNRKSNFMLILCSFLLVLCYKISMRNLCISRLIDEIAHWNKRFSSLYQCLLLSETKYLWDSPLK